MYIQRVEKTSIGIVQINNEFDGQVYLPLVAGYLESVVKQDPVLNNEFSFIEPIFTRLQISDAISHLKNCMVVGFSVYVWNEQITLKIAAELKIQNANVLIIFGGPQVPDNAEEYMNKHKFIDICVHNEGEIAFMNILKNYKSNSFENIPNTSTRKFDSNQVQIIKSPNDKRLNGLSAIPSPFLNGIFDKILAQNPNRKFLALWESNRGCPFQCSFCDWGSATASKVNQFEIERLKLEIEWIAKSKIEFVFVCDANFGILPRDEEIAKYVSEMKEIYGYPKAFSVQNTKNVKERAFGVQKLLAASGLGKGVTLSMQSLNEDTLKLIKRDNISLESYEDLQNRFRESKVLTYSDLILGLPGETLGSWKMGIGKLISSGQHNRIQFNNLSILPNAEMGSLEYQKLHGFEKVTSQIVNVHGSKSSLDGDVPEYQELVVSTGTMGREDWIKARVFAWWVAFLYFDKIAQIPIMLLTANSGKSTIEIIEFILKNVPDNSVLEQINTTFTNHALSIQKGGIEYVWDPELIDVFWPADEYAFITLCRNKVVDDFYNEISLILKNFETTVISKIENTNEFHSLDLAILLNKYLLNVPEGLQTHFLPEKAGLLFDWYLKAPYEKNLNIDISQLSDRKMPERTFFEFEKWCREIVWYGHRSGSYIFSSEIFEIDKDESKDEIPGLLT